MLCVPCGLEILFAVMPLLTSEVAFFFTTRPITSFFFFLRSSLFERGNACDQRRSRVGEGKRGERIFSRLLAELRDWCWAWSHDSEMMTWPKSKSWVLNRLSHPGAPRPRTSNIISKWFQKISYLSLPSRLKTFWSVVIYLYIFTTYTSSSL